MKRLQDLRDSANGIAAMMKRMHNDCLAIQGRADAQKRDITPAEQATLDRLQADFDAHDRELKAVRRELDVAEREEARADEREAFIMAQASARSTRQVAPNPIASSDPMQPRRRAAPAIGRSVPTIANMFGGNHADPYRGAFGSLGELALAVASGTDGRIFNAGMTTNPGQDGGFAVPVEFLGPVLDAALQLETIRPRANVIPMASKQAVAGLFDYADGTTNKRAGLTLTWGSEATAMTEQKGKLREIELNAHKASILVRVSNELAADAPAFDRQLSQAMVAAVAAGLDYAFVQGTGAGQPMGILTSPCLITQAKESGQAANTLLLQNLAGMAGRLAPECFANAVWLVHPTVVVKLYMMSFVVQNLAGSENVGGSNVQAITQDASGQLRIFGRPCLVTEAASALSSAGDVLLADLSRYVVGLRADATIAKDQSRYFDSDELAFRLTIRVDGQSADAAARKLRDGTNTVSPFVALGAR